MLFEILACEPLHPRTDTLASTLSHPSGAPGAYAKLDVAPELEAACLAALAAHPADRPTARELAEKLQRYLDGDRDLGRRRALAAEELERANAALVTDDRATAMASAGRALALDPESRSAARIVTSLLLEPPRELPAELVRHLDDVDQVFERKQWRIASLAFVAFMPFFPLMVWQGIINWLTFSLMIGFVVLQIIHAELNHRRIRPYVIPISLALNFGICVLFARMLGPFMIVPSIITVLALSWMSYPTTLARPWPPVISLLAAIVVPLVLEAAGVLSSTWRVDGDTIATTSAVLSSDGPLTTVLLISGTLGTAIVAFVIARSLALSRRDALRKVEIQAWHLRKLLPAER